MSKNVVFPAWEITPWMLSWTRERDGIEIYVLYTLVLAIIGTSTLLTNFLVKTKLTRIQNCLILVLFFIPSCWLFLDSSFAPPAKIPSSDLSIPLLLYTDFARVFYSALIGISVLILVYIQTKLSDSKEFILAAILSIPFLFIATTPVAISNYSYLFAPAQKMLNGISISEIYFQYDFLISAIAAMWMTAGFDLNWFHVLGQASNYIAILAVFCMAKKLFELKSLPLLLFISLILIKVASAPWDPVFVFQITALRLDLWLVPFIVIYHWGPLHRITVFTFGILVLIHGSFGLIYTIGYIQLLLTLSFFSIRDVGIKDFFKRYSNARTSFVIKLAFLLACFVLSRIIFGKSMMATSWYQKIGIGFMPLVSWSFYWIYPVVIASASALLLLMRSSLPAKYLIQATVLIYFTTGNCIYFFGRSDEMNLFSISIPLLFLFFFTLDLFDRWLNVTHYFNVLKIKITPGTTSAFILIICASYTCFEKISWNVSMQTKYATDMDFLSKKANPYLQAKSDTELVLKELRTHIGPAATIKYMTTSEGDEFYFNHHKFTNSFFCYPYASCIFLPEVINKMKEYLNAGNYVLVDRIYARTYLTRLTDLRTTYPTKSGKYILLGK